MQKLPCVGGGQGQGVFYGTPDPLTFNGNCIMMQELAAGHSKCQCCRAVREATCSGRYDTRSARTLLQPRTLHQTEPLLQSLRQCFSVGNLAELQLHNSGVPGGCKCIVWWCVATANDNAKGAAGTGTGAAAMDPWVLGTLRAVYGRSSVHVSSW